MFTFHEDIQLLPYGDYDALECLRRKSYKSGDRSLLTTYHINQSLYTTALFPRCFLWHADKLHRMRLSRNDGVIDV